MSDSIFPSIIKFNIFYALGQFYMDGFEKEKVGNILWSSLVCNQVIIEPREYGFVLITNLMLVPIS